MVNKHQFDYGQDILQQQQQQSFYGPLSGTTRVSRYQKKHSLTHPPFWSSSSLYQLLPFTTIHPPKLRAWQFFCTTSVHVLFGLPLGLESSTSYSYISSPSHCLLFAAHAHTIATFFAVFGQDMCCVEVSLLVCTVSQMALTAFTQQSVSSWRLSLSLCVREEHHSMLVTLVMNLPSGKHYRLVLMKSPMFWWVFYCCCYCCCCCCCIIRPHHSTMYVDVVCCYRPSCGLSVTLVSPAKMACCLSWGFGWAQGIMERGHFEGVEGGSCGPL